MAGDGVADMRCAQNARVDGCWLNPGRQSALPEDLTPRNTRSTVISLLPPR